jgi:hypothetical protein
VLRYLHDPVFFALAFESYIGISLDKSSFVIITPTYVPSASLECVCCVFVVTPYIDLLS